MLGFTSPPFQVLHFLWTLSDVHLLIRLTDVANSHLAARLQYEQCRKSFAFNQWRRLSRMQAWWIVSPAGKEVIYSDLWYSCNSTCYPVENSHSASAGKRRRPTARYVTSYLRNHVGLNEASCCLTLPSPPLPSPSSSLPAGRPSHHDPGHHSMLHELLCLHPSALQAPAGGEIRFHRHHPAAGLWVRRQTDRQTDIVMITEKTLHQLSLILHSFAQFNRSLCDSATITSQ